MLPLSTGQMQGDPKLDQAIKALNTLLDASKTEREEKKQEKKDAVRAANNAKLQADVASARAGTHPLFIMFPRCYFLIRLQSMPTSLLMSYLSFITLLLLSASGQHCRRIQASFPNWSAYKYGTGSSYKKDK